MSSIEDENEIQALMPGRKDPVFSKRVGIRGPDRSGVTVENVANGWLKNLETEFEECASDFAVTPAGILLSKTENEAGNFLAGRWPSTLVIVGTGPFPANQIAMPAQHGFRLNDADNSAKLIGGLPGNPFQSSGQNSQRYLLNPVGSDRVIEFAFQNGQLLAKNENFQVFS
jgi:hypothetical protein